MKDFQILDKTFEPYLSEEKILTAVHALARHINTHYKDKKPLLIPILNGAFMFVSDLVKEIHIPCEVCFIKLFSYKGTATTSKVVHSIGLESNLLDRHVILIDDILDTGTTLHNFMSQDLIFRKPASIEVMVLLHKTENTIHHIENKVVGIEVKNRFLVGYGLDYDGYGRNSKCIYQLKQS